MTYDTYGHLAQSLDSEEADLDELLGRSGRGTYVARGNALLHPVEAG